MRLRTRLGVVTGAVAAGAVAGLAIASLAAPTAPDHSNTDLLMAIGDDRLPSQTATDWTTYADHVVVVEAVEEEAIPPTQVELDRGEGTIDRVVTLEIVEALWSRKDASEPAPKTWQYPAMGWQFKNGDTTEPIRMAMNDRPRVEVGHQYVMAIRWEEAQCFADGETTPARWIGLGEGSEIPYDDATLGKGEEEGQIQSVQQFTADAAGGPNEGLEEQLAGQGTDALVAALEAAPPDTAAQTQVEALEAETACG